MLFGCGIGSIVFAVMHWDRAKLPFLGHVGLGFLSGALLATFGFSALKQGAATGGNGEVTLPTFGGEVGRPATAGGAEPEPKPSAKVAVAAPVPAETLPFTPTARLKPFPYKDGSAPGRRPGGVNQTWPRLQVMGSSPRSRSACRRQPAKSEWKSWKRTWLTELWSCIEANSSDACRERRIP